MEKADVDNRLKFTSRVEIKIVPENNGSKIYDLITGK